MSNYRESVSWGSYYWPYFLVLVSLLFGVPELIALATNRLNTLSDYAYRELNVTAATVANGVHTVAWWVSLAGWLLFVVVITWHIWWAGP